MIRLVIIGKDAGALKQFGNHNFALPGFSGLVSPVLIDNSIHQMPLSRIANSYLDPCAHPVFGLVHADVLFDSPMARMNGQRFRPDLEILQEVAMAGRVCGIVGADLLPQRYWWGHSLPEGVEHPVSCLDGCSIFFRADLDLHFDEQTFDGFHCHVEDLCLQAHMRGIPVVVPAVKTDHAGRSTYDPAWQKQYAEYKHKLCQKWDGKLVFQTT
jgi:Glycosyltransferase like family